jgi:hypothetical protein
MAAYPSNVGVGASISPEIALVTAIVKGFDWKMTRSVLEVPSVHFYFLSRHGTMIVARQAFTSLFFQHMER